MQTSNPKNVPTFIGKIYVGSKIGYTKTNLLLEAGETAVQGYVDEIGQCFTVTRTKFIYKNGSEDGLIVGLINYPRFPKEFALLEDQLLELAYRLKLVMQQQRVTVVLPDRTIMLGAQE